MKISRHIDKNGLDADFGTEAFSKRYIDKQDVLQKFTISERTLQTWRSNRLLAHCKIGKKIYYLREDIDRLIQNSTIPSIGNKPIDSESDLDALVSISKKESIQLPTDSASLQSVQTSKPRSFSSLWDPIPPYVVPFLVILIYLASFATEIIKGEPISAFSLLLPIIFVVVGYAIYWLIRLCVWISRKLTGWKKETAK
jgi:hypothetical protein